MRRGLVLALLLLPPASAWAQSHPVFFADAPSVARYAAAKANYDANPSSPTGVNGQWYKYLKDMADANTEPWGEHGAGAALLYRISGDAAYAQVAYNLMSPLRNNPANCTNNGLGGNVIREDGWKNAWIYDQIYSGLNQTQRDELLARINIQMGCVDATGRRDDSDQTTGEFFAIALWVTATGSYNSTANTIWNDATRKIGGWDATDSTLGNTRRNAIKYYIEQMSAGGEFLESTEYDLNTIKLMILPNAALKSAGVTSFPEIDTWQQDAALSFIHVVTPGMSGVGSVSPYQRADIQEDNMMDHYRLETCLALAGVTAGGASGPYIQDFCLDYLARGSFQSFDPYSRGFIVFDSAATRGDHTTLDRNRFNAGVGLLTTRTGWGTSDSMFGANFPPYYAPAVSSDSLIDHEMLLWGEFQLWKNGKWAIRHPIGYGGPPMSCLGSNTVCIEGLDVTGVGTRQYRSIRAHREDFTNQFHYIVGTSGGASQKSALYGGRQTNLHEDTRSFVYLSAWDVVVVYDRINADNISTTDSWINSRSRTELYVHTPVSPTLGTGTIQWDYAAGEGAKVSNLLPATSTRTIQDESTYWATLPTWINPVGSVKAYQLKYDVKIVPAEAKWTKFLNVWDAYGSGTPATVSLVQDTTNLVDAALVTKGSQSVLTAFNAVQGPDVPLMRNTGGFYYWQSGVDTILNTVRLRSSDFTLTWTSAVPTKALLFDLNPIATWTYTINGGGSQSLTPDSNGIGVIDIATTGSVTLAVTGEGGIPTPVVVDTTTIPDCRVGAAYSQAIAASGGLGAPYTCTKTVGDLPAGLSLNAACATGITGTPSAITADNSLTKTTVDGWTAGAYSSDSLAAGDGYVETTAAETNTWRVIGLSNGNTNTDYSDVDFAINPSSLSRLFVFEGGVNKGQFGTYAAGDVLKVAVVSGAVKYYKNGSLLYTSATSPTYPLIVDSALYHLGSTLKNVVIDFGGGAVNATWAAVTGATVSGGSTRTFTVQACDSTPSCGTQQYTMNILSTPTVTTATLPDGEVGTAYSQTPTVVGGAAPLAYSTSPANFCPGLSINASTGAITGTPTTVGTCSFTFIVTDNASLVGDHFYQIVVAAALPELSVSATPIGTSVIIRYGIASLDAADSCTCSLMSGATVENTFTNATGAARRTCYFTNLTQGATYGVDVLCGTAQAARSYFTVPLHGNVGGTVSWKYSATPTASLLARSVTKLRVSYAIPGDLATTVSAACTSGCTVTLPLTSGLVYELSHEWLTAADAVVASSATYPVAVP